MEDKFSLITFKDFSPSLSAPKLPNKESSSSKKPLGPPAETKKVLTEELARLKSSISGSQTLDIYMHLDEEYLDIKDSSEFGQPDDRYQQGYQDFIKRKVYEIPEILSQKYRESKDYSVLSGILPEICRVWYSYDNIIYFWDYTKTNTYTEFPVADDIVVNVSLVPKNNDLFTNKVRYMLLIATKNQISFVGVSLEPEFKLIEAEVKLTTDEVAIECVSVLNNGRIFMGGADGSVTELKYSSGSWFANTKKYKKSDISSSFISMILPKFIKDLYASRVTHITVDGSRNILYSLATNAERNYWIEVYDLGVKCNLNKKVCKITSAQMLQRLREHSQRVFGLNAERLEIIYIEALTRQLSIDCHLLAITRNGIRIIFRFNQTPSEESLLDPILSLRPVDSFTISLKFPPAAVKYTGKLEFQRNAVGNASDKPSWFDNNLMTESGNLIVLEKTERAARLLCIGRNLSRIALLQTEGGRNSFEPDETVSCFEDFNEVDIQHVKEVRAMNKMQLSISRLCNFLPRNEYREKSLIRYLGCPAGMLSFECLSSISNILYRPSSDLLVLTSKQLIEYTEIRPIDLLYQALVSAQNPDKITEFVQRFGVLHSCALLLALIIGPVIVNSLEDTITTPLPDREKQRAFSLFKDIGNHKINDSNLYSLRLDDPLMCLAEYKSLYTYVARILRPIWEECISCCDGEVYNQIEQFQAGELQEVKSRLRSFKDFISSYYADSIKKPGNSVFNLWEFIKRNEDCLELLSMITEDYSFRRVVNELIIEDQILLKSTTYRGLVSTDQGHYLAKSLIEGYVMHLRNPRIQRQRRPSLGDTLKSLNAKCSSFFTLVDSEIYIAQECLFKALSAEHPQQRNELLDEAMKRLLRNAASVGLGKISRELKQLRCYRGIICLCIQKAIDILSVKAADGKEEIEECYEFLSRILNDLKDCMFGYKSSSEWFNEIPLEALGDIKNEIVSEFCKHQDKNVHRILFTWLVDCGLSNEILLIDSPYTKAFIEESIRSNLIRENDLLAKYCYKMKDFLNSYKEFDRLASLKKGEFTIEERLKHLDMCTICLDNILNNFTGAKEDKISYEQERDNHLAKKALARIQYNTKQEMQMNPKLVGASIQLNQELLSINDLYENFSKKYELYMIQFQILDYIHTYTPKEKKEVEIIMKSTYIPLINECADMNWPAVISEKLAELGTKYPYGFNLDLIIKKTENLNITKKIESNWLITLLVSLPIEAGYAEIWDIYYSLWKNAVGDTASLYYFTVRLEAIVRGWFSDLKKRLVDSAIWNKTNKEKASPHKFIERSQEIMVFFDNVKATIGSFNSEQIYRIGPALTLQEQNYNSLMADIAPGESGSSVLKRRINFDVSDLSSEKNSKESSIQGISSVYRRNI